VVDLQNRLVKDIKFYIMRQRYYWKAFLFYRLSSSIWLSYALLRVIFNLLTISVIYGVSSGVAGWSYFQMLFLIATSSIVFGTLFYNIDPGSINYQLRTGSVDPSLIRPYGKVTIFLSMRGALSSAAEIAGSLVLLTYAAINIGLSPFVFLSYLILVIFGTIALMLFTLMLTILTYQFLKNAYTVSRLLSFMSETSRYPLTVYGFMGQLIFTLLLPVGLASYYPSQAFLSTISSTKYFSVILVSIAVAVISYLLFNKLMEHYTSGGG
jgi:ABC-2 type transport system permease protein